MREGHSARSLSTYTSTAVYVRAPAGDLPSVSTRLASKWPSFHPRPNRHKYSSERGSDPFCCLLVEATCLKQLRRLGPRVKFPNRATFISFFAISRYCSLRGRCVLRRSTPASRVSARDRGGRRGDEADHPGCEAKGRVPRNRCEQSGNTSVSDFVLLLPFDADNRRHTSDPEIHLSKQKSGCRRQSAARFGIFEIFEMLWVLIMTTEV